MCSLMRRQIDQFRSFAHAANGCLSHSFPIPNQSDHAAVVIGIHFAVKKEDAGKLHCLNNGIDHRFVAAFRKIGNAFDKSGHHWRG